VKAVENASDAVVLVRDNLNASPRQRALYTEMIVTGKRGDLCKRARLAQSRIPSCGIVDGAVDTFKSVSASEGC
jgi:hypothetical protein